MTLTLDIAFQDRINQTKSNIQWAHFEQLHICNILQHPYFTTTDIQPASERESDPVAKRDPLLEPTIQEGSSTKPFLQGPQFILGLKHHLEVLYQCSSNYDPGVNPFNYAAYPDK